jgi:hypothetical protein
MAESVDAATGIVQWEVQREKGVALGDDTPTKGRSWGYPVPGLGTVSPFLDPFCGHLSPKGDEIFQK